MTEKERMLAGLLYVYQEPELQADFQNCKRITELYNSTTSQQEQYRELLLRELFEKVGKNIKIQPPLHCDYGCHISVGDNFFANYECIFLDVCKVSIGDNVMFGPRVSVYAAGHPIDAGVRASGLEFGKPITIGSNVWVGGNSVINPGVTIGDNVVIGSGSVVVKDIPPNVVAAGNPCRVLRQITDEDKRYWEGLQSAYWSEKGNGSQQEGEQQQNC